MSLHEQVRFHCDFCNIKTASENGLRNHKKMIHSCVGIEYQCDTCNYKASEKHKLGLFKKSLHVGENYPCK